MTYLNADKGIVKEYSLLVSLFTKIALSFLPGSDLITLTSYKGQQFIWTSWYHRSYWLRTYWTKSLFFIPQWNLDILVVFGLGTAFIIRHESHGSELCPLSVKDNLITPPQFQGGVRNNEYWKLFNEFKNWKKKKKKDNCTILIPRRNSYCWRKSSAKDLGLKYHLRDYLIPEIDIFILIRLPIQVLTKAAVA